MTRPHGLDEVPPAPGYEPTPWERLFGINPRRAEAHGYRHGFPTSWGEPPGDPEARAAWIAVRARREAAAKGDAVAALEVLADAELRLLSIARAAALEARRPPGQGLTPTGALAVLRRRRRCP